MVGLTEPSLFPVPLLQEQTCDRPLKVVQINTWDRAGGAAGIAQQLHEALRGLGHEMRLLAGFGLESDGSVEAVLSRWPRWKQLCRRATMAVEDLLSWQYCLIWWSSELVNHPWVQVADLVQLHNLHGGYLSPSVLPRLSQIKPVIWTLHDMWPLTGHCAYSLDCGRWRTGCGRCPYLREYPDLWHDQTALLWRRKRQLYAKSHLTLVTPSRWLADLVRQSPLLGHFPVVRIPNGVDLRHYRMLPKGDARARLGLPQGNALVLFIAESLDEDRKGGRQLAKALSGLRWNPPPPLSLVTVGRGAARVAWPTAIDHIDLGFVQDQALLPVIYSAVDIMVCPSLADNLPNTVLEAMACGTPVIAFTVGGIPEVVRHLETGYLATAFKPDDLAHGLELLLRNEPLRCRLSLRCRQVAEQEHSLDLQAKRYVELYREAVLRWQGAQAQDR